MQTESLDETTRLILCPLFLQTNLMKGEDNGRLLQLQVKILPVRDFLRAFEVRRQCRSCNHGAHSRHWQLYRHGLRQSNHHQ